MLRAVNFCALATAPQKQTDQSSKALGDAGLKVVGACHNEDARSQSFEDAPMQGRLPAGKHKTCALWYIAAQLTNC